MGHVSLVNIDDGISGAHDRVSSRAASLIERGELVTSGLKCNARQVGDWLGYLANTIQMIFQVPVLKIEKPKAAPIHAVLNCQSVPVRDKLPFNNLVMVYKCLKNLTPGYFHGCFQYRAKIHQRVSRQNNGRAPKGELCNKVCMYVHCSYRRLFDFYDHCFRAYC